MYRKRTVCFTFCLFLSLILLRHTHTRAKLCSFRMNVDAIETALKQSVSVNNVWHTPNVLCIHSIVSSMQYDLLSMGVCMRNAFDVVAPSGVREKKILTNLTICSSCQHMLINIMKPKHIKRISWLLSLLFITVN